MVSGGVLDLLALGMAVVTTTIPGYVGRSRCRCTGCVRSATNCLGVLGRVVVAAFGSERLSNSTGGSEVERVPIHVALGDNQNRWTPSILLGLANVHSTFQHAPMEVYGMVGQSLRVVVLQIRTNGVGADPVVNGMEWTRRARVLHREENGIATCIDRAHARNHR